MTSLRRTAILSAFIAASLLASAQDITLKATDRPAAEVFRSIMQQTDKNFVYSSDLLKDLRVSVNANKRPLKKVLDDMFRGTDIGYRIKGKNVILKKKKTKSTKTLQTMETSRKPSAPAVHIPDTVAVTALQTIEVVSQSENQPLQTAKLGVSTLSGADIRRTPAFLGEADVVKALKILPGVAEATEGLAGINVHGGNADENMVMLENVPMYQADHFAGLFSPFNAGIVRSADFYKTSVPARFDGRLSSFLDVHLRNGNTQGHHGSARLGLTSGAFDISGPIGSRTTYLVGVRRSWFDVLSTPAIAIVNSSSNDEKIRLGYHFMDANAKIDHRFSDKVKGFVNLYYGDDMLKTGTKDAKMPDSGFYSDYKCDFNWGNAIAQAGVDYSMSSVLSARFSGAYTRYFNHIKNDDLEKEISSQHTSTTRDIISNDNAIDNFTLSGDFTLHSHENNTLRFGASYIHHSFLPEKSYRESIVDQISLSSRFSTGGIAANQADAYVEDDWNISERLHAEGGLHASLFAIDGKTKGGLSPRFAISFNPTASLALKGAYTHTVQYVHRIEETYLSLPCDRWVPAVGGFRPMTADKVSLGGYWQTRDGAYAVSLEGYWKSMHHLLDYKDEYYLQPAKGAWEDRLTSGKGSAKGIDIMVEKKNGNLTGHVSYSLAWADRQYAEKNNGHRFPARFDHRHTVKAFLNWDISSKVSVSALWTGHSGNRFTFLPQRFEQPSLPGAFDYTHVSWDGTPMSSSGEAPLKAPLNNYQLPFYHRLDLSCTVRNRRGYWDFGLYNAYCNMNTVAIVADHSTSFTYVTDAPWGQTYNSTPVFKKLKLLPIIPSISYTWIF